MELFKTFKYKTLLTPILIFTVYFLEQLSTFLHNMIYLFIFSLLIHLMDLKALLEVL